MSASNQKKLRKEQQAVYKSERERIEANDRKKLKIYTASFWIVMALCVCIVLGTVVTNPIKNIIYRNTDALTVGEHTLTAVDVNYFYVDCVQDYVAEMGQYINYVLDTSKPLNEQVADKTTNATWADNFLDQALETIKETYALYDLAVQNNHKLTEDEQSTMDSVMNNVETYAKIYGYANGNTYLRVVYGNGATAESYRDYYYICAMADSYFTKYSEDLEYDGDALRAYEADKLQVYNSYTYATYFLGSPKFYEGGTKDDKGNMTYTDAEKQAAAERAEKVANELAAGTYATLEDFNTAIKNLEINKGLENVKAEEKKDILFSKVESLFAEWVTGKTEKKAETDKDDAKPEGQADEDKKEEEKEYEYIERKEGEMTVIAKESGSGDKKVIDGYYIVRFEKLNKNVTPLKNVRHILVQFEGGTPSSSGQTTYTKEQKEKAKAEAEKLLAEWKNGAKTEDSFADMASKHSDDPSSKKEGGLYEDVYPGQMVEAFNDWCYDEKREVGDTGIVETEYGYHIMFFVGDSETTYRDYMITNDIRAEDVKEWREELVKAMNLEKLNLKYVEMDMVLSH